MDEFKLFTSCNLRSQTVTFGHTATVTECGELWVRGWNSWGQLGLGDRKFRNQPTRVDLPEAVQAAGTTPRLTVIVTESGSLWLSGQRRLRDDADTGSRFTRVDLPSRVVSMCVGYDHAAVVTENGQLWVCAHCRGIEPTHNRFFRIDLPRAAKSVSSHSLAIVEVKTKSGALRYYGFKNDELARYRMGTTSLIDVTPFDKLMN